MAVQKIQQINLRNIFVCPNPSDHAITFTVHVDRNGHVFHLVDFGKSMGYMCPVFTVVKRGLSKIIKRGTCVLSVKYK